MSHVSQAAAEIVALINSSPRSPRPDQIAAIIAKALAPQPVASSLASSPLPQLGIDIRNKIAELQVAYSALGPLSPGPEEDAAEAVVEQLKADLCRLELQIPEPPQSYADIRMRAEMALYWSAGSIDELRQYGELVQHTLADLIEAVLQFDGSPRHLTAAFGS